MKFKVGDRVKIKKVATEEEATRICQFKTDKITKCHNCGIYNRKIYKIVEIGPEEIMIDISDANSCLKGKIFICESSAWDKVNNWIKL